MAKENDIFTDIEEELANSGLTMEEIERNIPLIYSLMTSSKDRSMRTNDLVRMLATKEFQKELKGFDKFKDFDFSKYNESSEVIKDLPKNLNEADIKDVEAWYNKAKQAIDPHGRLGDTELYDTAGPKTFELLEGDEDWFGTLLDAFGYPTGTPEEEAKSMEQLTQDFQTALTRMKNHNFMDKFGKAKTPLKFVFGRSAEVLDEGKKPTIGDVFVDTASNALWTMPFANWFRVGKSLPIGTKIAQNVGLSAIAPVTSEALDTVLGTDTEKEKRRGMKGRAEDAAINTAINMAAPALVKRVPMMATGILDRLKLNSKDAGLISQWLSNRVDYGNSQETAKAALAGMAEVKDEAAQVISKFAERLAGKKGRVGKETLSNIISWLPTRQRAAGTALAKMIGENNGSFRKGKDAYLKSLVNILEESVQKELANAPETLLDSVRPYLWTYVVNRAGTQGIGGWIRRRFGRTTRPWETETEE